MKNNKQYAVIGLGRMGISVVETLARAECDVLAIDINKENIDEIDGIATRTVIADSTDINALKSIGISNFDVVVIGIGTNLESNIMTAVLLKELGVKYIVAKAKNKRHKAVLEKLGVDKVILPEAEMGMRIAMNLMNKNILDYIEFSTDYSIVELKPKPEWIGKNLIVLNLRTKYGINVIAIKKHGQVDVMPTPEYVIKSDDIIVSIIRSDN